MSDTQWTIAVDPAGNNPNGVSVSIINQINQQFIDKGVKFVIQVGDLTENGNNADIALRAAAAKPLYNAGIGFYLCAAITKPSLPRKTDTLFLHFKTISSRPGAWAILTALQISAAQFR